MTSNTEYSPCDAAMPPMITQVSLGTIGITESKKAMTKITPRNHQFPERSNRLSVKSLMIPANMMQEPTGPFGRPVVQPRGSAGRFPLARVRAARARSVASAGSSATTVRWPIVRPGRAAAFP